MDFLVIATVSFKRILKGLKLFIVFSNARLAQIFQDGISVIVLSQSPFIKSRGFLSCEIIMTLKVGVDNKRKKNCYQNSKGVESSSNE